MATGLMHFMVDFDGITTLLRDMWAEGSYTKARNVLDSLGLDPAYYERILFGEFKLAQDPDGVEGVDGMLVADDWAPDLNRCSYRLYPRFGEIGEIERKLQEYKGRYFSNLQMTVNLMREEARRKADGQRLYEIQQWLKTLPDDFVRWMGKSDREWVAKFTRDERIGELAELGYYQAPDLDRYIEHQLELEKMSTPEPDKEFASKYGWILPSGEFYPCARADHSWLTSR